MIAAFALCVFLAASSAHAEYAERGKFVLAPSGALDIGPLRIRPIPRYLAMSKA